MLGVISVVSSTIPHKVDTKRTTGSGTTAAPLYTATLARLQRPEAEPATPPEAAREPSCLMHSPVRPGPGVGLVITPAYVHDHHTSTRIGSMDLEHASRSARVHRPSRECCERLGPLSMLSLHFTLWMAMLLPNRPGLTRLTELTELTAGVVMLLPNRPGGFAHGRQRNRTLKTCTRRSIGALRAPPASPAVAAHAQSAAAPSPCRAPCRASSEWTKASRQRRSPMV